MIAPGPQITGREDDRPQEAGDAERQEVDPLQKLLADMMAVRKYAVDYMAAEADLFRAVIRRWILSAAVGAMLAVIGLTGLISAVVFALRGLAGLVNDLSGIFWLGELVIGCGILLAALFAGWAILSGRLGASRRKTLEMYKQKKTEGLHPDVRQ